MNESPHPHPQPNHHIEGRVAVLERGMNDLTITVNTGFTNQREENIRLYNAVATVGRDFTAGLDSVKAALASRGQVTGSFVLLLITTALSLIAIIGGIVHFYVSDQIGNVRAEVLRNTAIIASHGNQIQDVRVEAAKQVESLGYILTEERIRAIKADAEHDVETRYLKEKKGA